MLYRIASFDPGKKNFAFCVEEFETNEIEDHFEYNRYCPDGTCSETFQPIVDNVCKRGKVVLYNNVDLTTTSNKHSYLEMEYLHSLTDHLDKYGKIWDTCNVILIEKQMSFGKKYNTMALKIAQHCWSYFAIRYGRFKEVLEFPAYHKTQILGSQKICKKLKNGKTSFKTIDKPARKKWCINKAMDILKSRDEMNIIKQLTSVKKKDDLADVLCMIQAYKIMTFIK